MHSNYRLVLGSDLRGRLGKSVSTLKYCIHFRPHYIRVGNFIVSLNLLVVYISDVNVRSYQVEPDVAYYEGAVSSF